MPIYQFKCSTCGKTEERIQVGKIRLGVPTPEPQPVNRAQRRAKK